MRRTTENRGNTRKSSEDFSPKSKGQNSTLHGCIVPRLTVSQQEIPMKLSQIPNQFPYSPRKRLLQLQSPKQPLKDRPDSQFLPVRSKPQHLPGLQPISPIYRNCSANRVSLTPRHRQARLQHCAQPLRKMPKSPLSPSGICHPAAPEIMKDLSSHSAASNNRAGQVAKSEHTPLSSESEAACTHSQKSKKNLWPCVTHAHKMREAQKVCPSRSSGSYSQPPSSPSSPSTLHPAASYQDHRHKQTSLCEKSSQGTPQCSSMKRSRQVENPCDSDKRQKKLCPFFFSENEKTGLSRMSSGESPVSQPSPVKASSKNIHHSIKPGMSSISTLKQPESPHPSTKPYFHSRPSEGAKQVFVNVSKTCSLTLSDTRSPPTLDRGSLKKRVEDADKGDKESLSSSSCLPRKDTGSSPRLQSANYKPGHSASASKTASKGNTVKESSRPESSKPVTKTTAACHKTHRPHRPSVSYDDISDLFKPDPCVVSPTRKTAKPKTEATGKTPSPEKSCSDSSSPPNLALTASPSCHTQPPSPHTEDSKGLATSPVSLSPHLSPIVLLHRVKRENLQSVSPGNTEPKTSPVAASDREQKHMKPHKKHKCTSSDNVRRSSSETHSPASEQRPAHPCPQSPGLETQGHDSGPKEVHEEDLTDMELDIGLSFAVDFDLTQSSASSEEDEELLSLEQMVQRVNKPPEPGRPRCQSKSQPVLSATKSCYYKNTIDQMLKEINTTKKAKEINKELMSECQDSLLQIAENEKSMEEDEEDQESMLRETFCNMVRDLPPGEEVFNLAKSGHIFNHNTLQLRQCLVCPQGTAEKTLLWSSPAQLRLHIISGLFQQAYQCHSPCPTQVTRFLFKMMSVHTERMVSDKILQVLCDIACSAAYQRVNNHNQEFEVWVPSLADVALVLLNMGAPFVKLFPPESLQPPFTEQDLLEDVYIKSEPPDDDVEQISFSENYNNILKYLSCCMDLCPRAYSDDELLQLLTVVGRVGLDTRLILRSSLELDPLLYKVVNNFRDWDAMLWRTCLALTDLTDHHRNMCQLVQMLPDSTRGKQLRQHLSMAMISKLLNGKCTYCPKEKDIQLSDLRPYLSRILPHSLGPIVKRSRAQQAVDAVPAEDAVQAEDAVPAVQAENAVQAEDSVHDEDVGIAPSVDQQCYSLCYSLLTMVDIASHIHFISSHQKEQLLFLCYDLEKYIKSQIREGYKHLDSAKVSDLVARIDIRWQRLVLKTNPLHAKLNASWRPPGADRRTGE